jgi:hypothetical protein
MAIALAVFVCGAAGSAQIEIKKCRGSIYEAKDVAVRAKITKLPDFHVLSEALGAGVQAHVVLEAVLCRSGAVTDIRVLKSEPPNAAEFVVGALSLMTFKPAESNWHSVSQRQTFDFTFNERGISAMDAVKEPGRLIEEVDIIGNRRLTKEEILGWIKTRPGDPYDPDQVKQDLQALLKTGRLNALTTRVQVEDAVRGGVRVIFELSELPLIAEVAFGGSAGLTNRSAILNELARQGVDLEFGRPFDLAILKKATKVIEDYFRSQGWINVKAEASVENLTANDVRIVFKISGTNF